MSQTSRDRVNSGRVRTHEKNSGEAVRRLGTIIQSIFWASIRLTVWKWSGESRYPRVFPPVLKTFVAPFLPARLTAPGSPRMRSHKIWLLSISKFFVYCCHSNIDFIWNYIFTNSIHSQLLVKILQRLDKEKSTFKSIEKYDLWKTVSKHLKVKSIKMFTERLCDKGIGNVLNFRIEVSLGE